MLGFTRAGEKLLLVMFSPFLALAAVIALYQALLAMAEHEPENLNE